MNESLFKRTVKLAHSRPDLRPALLPLIKKYADMSEGMTAEEILAAKYKGRMWGDWAHGKGKNNKNYKPENANATSGCYEQGGGGGKGTPGEGTCYRLHNEYGSGATKDMSKYNKDYQEKYLNNNSQIKRKTCPDGRGGKGECGGKK